MIIMLIKLFHSVLNRQSVVLLLIPGFTTQILGQLSTEQNNDEATVSQNRTRQKRWGRQSTATLMC